MYYLSIGAVTRNEAAYIEEWIEFHLLQGVEHFFILDNESTDDTLKILQRYANEGIVTLGITKEHPCQRAAYNEILFRYKMLSKWIAFIDVDEFLYSPTGENLRNLLKPLRSYAGLAVHWKIFGSSDFKYKNPGLVIERFRHCAPEVNGHVKSIMQSAKTIEMDADPHTFIAVGQIIDENKKVQERHYAVVPGGTADLFCINHYATKSLEEALARWKLPRSDNHAIRLKGWEERFKSLDRNEVSNDYLLKYAPQVNEAIKRRRQRASYSNNSHRAKA